MELDWLKKNLSYSASEKKTMNTSLFWDNAVIVLRKT